MRKNKFELIIILIILLGIVVLYSLSFNLNSKISGAVSGLTQVSIQAGKLNLTFISLQNNTNLEVLFNHTIIVEIVPYNGNLINCNVTLTLNDTNKNKILSSKKIFLGNLLINGIVQNVSWNISSLNLSNNIVNVTATCDVGESSFNSINIKNVDTIPPEIFSILIDPALVDVNASIHVNFSARDNFLLKERKLNLSLVNGSVLTFNDGFIKNFSDEGIYNLTFIAIDSSNNTQINKSFFEVKLFVNFNTSVFDKENKIVNTTFYLKTLDNKIIKTVQITNNTSLKIPSGIYNAEYVSFENNFKVTFENISAANYELILYLDKLEYNDLLTGGFQNPEDYNLVIGYLVDVNFKNFSNAKIEFNYNITEDNNDDKKEEFLAFVCHDINFSIGKCLTKYEPINFTFNNVTKKVIFEVSSDNFSSFALTKLKPKPTFLKFGGGGGKVKSQCDNGRDDDGDGFIDWDGKYNTERDPGCEDKWDNDESNPCIEKWVCGEWSSCDLGRIKRKCFDLNECGTFKYKPIVSKICFEKPEKKATCDDNIKNQGEEGVDCGGPCEACKMCEKNEDCKSGMCVEGVCVNIVVPKLEPRIEKVSKIESKKNILYSIGLFVLMLLLVSLWYYYKEVFYYNK